MYMTGGFRPQPGLRRVLDAVKMTTAEMKATKDLVLSHTSEGHIGGNVVYLADVRNRANHNDDPSGPPPGAAAARSYELNFLRAVARDRHCAA
jgi:hypothetical protein